jgi:hypothetical protein
MQQPWFFVSYEGEMTDDDRATLQRPGWTLYENGIGSTAAFRGDEMPPVTWRQVVRIPAADADEARRTFVAALGREPAGLRVSGDDGADE